MPFVLLGLALAGLGAAVYWSAAEDPMLSPHFSSQEFLRSELADTHGWDNTDGWTAEYRSNAEALATHVLEPIRAALGRQVHIVSGYRSPQVNQAVGSTSSSHHTVGQAADIWVPNVSPEDIVHVVRQLQLPVAEVITYDDLDTVHVAHRRDGPNPGRIKRRIEGAYVTVGTV